MAPKRKPQHATAGRSIRPFDSRLQRKIAATDGAELTTKQSRALTPGHKQDARASERGAQECALEKHPESPTAAEMGMAAEAQHASHTDSPAKLLVGIARRGGAACTGRGVRASLGADLPCGGIEAWHKRVRPDAILIAPKWNSESCSGLLSPVGDIFARINPER